MVNRHFHIFKTLNNTYNVSEKELKILKNDIEIALKNIKQIEKALDTLQEQRENQEISKERFLDRKQIQENNITKLKKELVELRQRYENRKNNTNEKRLARIKTFYKQWENAKDTKERNKFLRGIVDKIYYTREGDNIDIKVNFL
jgi:chromosome segregation ATPase